MHGFLESSQKFLSIGLSACISASVTMAANLTLGPYFGVISTDFAFRRISARLCPDGASARALYLFCVDAWKD